MEFSWFDITIVAIILIIGIKGLVNGFIKELSLFVGIIGGIFVASRFAQKAGTFISNNIYNIQNDTATRLIGFVSLLFAVFIVSVLIGMIISKVIKFSKYAKLNKVLGFVLSSLTISLIFSTLAFALSSIEFTRTWVTGIVGNSFMYKKLSIIGEEIVDIHPTKLPNADKIMEKIEPVMEKSSEVTEGISDGIKIFLSNETNGVEQ